MTAITKTRDTGLGFTMDIEHKSDIGFIKNGEM